LQTLKILDEMLSNPDMKDQRLAINSALKLFLARTGSQRGEDIFGAKPPKEEKGHLRRLGIKIF
jgi:hypothetical protein